MNHTLRHRVALKHRALDQRARHSEGAESSAEDGWIADALAVARAFWLVVAILAASVALSVLCWAVARGDGQKPEPQQSDAHRRY